MAGIWPSLCACAEVEIAAYRAMGCRVSLFMDPVMDQMATAKVIGADRIEFYTGPYAKTYWTHGPSDDRTRDCFAQFCQAAEGALTAGLGINAGHDLDQENLPYSPHSRSARGIHWPRHNVRSSAGRLWATIKRYVEILHR